MRGALHVVNSVIPGSAHVNRLDLHWTGHQTINGFTLNDPEGKNIISFDQCDIQIPLWKLMMGKVEGDVHLSHGMFTFNVENKIWINFQSAFKSPQEIALLIKPHINSEKTSEEQTRKREYIDLSPSIKFESPQRHDFVVSEGDLFLKLDSNGNLTELRLVGVTTYGELKGNIKLSFSHETKRSLLESFLIGKIPSLDIHVDHFPSTFLDQLLFLSHSKHKDCFSALFGSSLDAEVSCDLDQTFHTTVLSPHLNGTLKGYLKDGWLRIEKSNFDFQITPQWINPFLPQKAEIVGDILLNIDLPFFSCPLNYFEKPQEDYSQWILDASVTFADKTELKTKRFGVLNIDNMKFSTNTSPNLPRFVIKAVGDISYYNRPSVINYERWFDKSSEIKKLIPKRYYSE